MNELEFDAEEQERAERIVATGRYQPTRAGFDAILRESEPLSLASMDAFDLRTEIAHGLSLSDGLRADVIDENTLMVIGTDSMPTRGLHLATGRMLHLTRDSAGEPWWCDRFEGRPLRGFGAHMPGTMTGIDGDLAWVRRRSEP
jgi:hypothetical protein